MEAQAAPKHHQPLRPGWDCDTCGAAWPCVPARERMLTAWTPVPRALTMYAYFHQAVDDQPAAPINELYDRFLGWVRGEA